MDEVITLYNEDKLLIRAMDWPSLSRSKGQVLYDCSTWANEFELLLNNNFTSGSSTLIIPGVGVQTYKSIGFLVNSDLANCFHIAKSDSGSCGDIKEGDFMANKPDFTTISELANYIKENNSKTMNEVNINASLDSVVGLFFNKSDKQDKLLALLLVASKCLKKMTGIDYPIYMYDWMIGKLDRVVLTEEQEKTLLSSLPTTNMFYWPDDYEDPVHVDCLESIQLKL